MRSDRAAEDEGGGGMVVAVSRSPTHTLSKYNQDSIRLLTGLGVEGDAHLGEEVRHRYQARRDPNRSGGSLTRGLMSPASGTQDALREAGFHAVWHGQKSYSGVPPQAAPGPSRSV